MGDPLNDIWDVRSTQVVEFIIYISVSEVVHNVVHNWHRNMNNSLSYYELNGEAVSPLTSTRPCEFMQADYIGLKYLCH